jgi:hypothetical protein
MTEKTKKKIEKAQDLFNQKGLIYDELSNGQLKVDTVNFWATTEKWYDPKTGTKGQGINSFFVYLKEQKIMS